MIEHKILISEEKLDKRIRELAKQISEDYKGEDITLICTLKGAVYFTIDLSKKITDSDVILDFIRVSSYGINNRETTGKLDFKLDISEENNVSSPTFYYHLKQLRKKACEIPASTFSSTSTDYSGAL